MHNQVQLKLSPLSDLAGVKKRLECIATRNNIAIYRDFAHHPSAILTTLEAMAHAKGPDGRLIAVFEPRSYTMKKGVHQDQLLRAFLPADHVLAYQADTLGFDLKRSLSDSKCMVFEDHQLLYDTLMQTLGPNDKVVFLSNGDFMQLPEKVASAF